MRLKQAYLPVFLISMIAIAKSKRCISSVKLEKSFLFYTKSIKEPRDSSPIKFQKSSRKNCWKSMRKKLYMQFLTTQNTLLKKR